MSPTERTPIVTQLCLRSQIGLWGKYYYVLFHVKHYLSSNGGIVNIIVHPTGQSGADTEYVIPTGLGQWEAE